MSLKYNYYGILYVCMVPARNTPYIILYIDIYCINNYIIINYC